MRVAGIIAEYNPLHNGHLHHIEKTRKLTECDYVIVVMSGDFVQRGEPAIADKFTRAKWALQAGADLVLELPAVFALSSAERFAYGGVRVLAGTGVVNALCFGSENPDINALKQGAQTLSKETPAFRNALREQLSIGKSFPRARYDALEAVGVERHILELIKSPNSILGLEYMRFLTKYAPEIEPVAIVRIGNAHDEGALTGVYSSASAIRGALIQGDEAVYDCMPTYVGSRFALDVKPVSINDASSLLIYSLRRTPPEEYINIPDVQEGFENLLHRCAMTASSIGELLPMIKSKRYTLARCKRIVFSSMLGITKELLECSKCDDALYLRVLGFRQSARRLLTAISNKGSMRLVVRKADMEKCSANAKRLLTLDIDAHSIYGLLSAPQSTYADFSRPPIVL